MQARVMWVAAVVVACGSGSGDSRSDGGGGPDGASADSAPCTASDSCEVVDSYCTSFDGDEAPISEGGRWAHDPGNPWQKIRTVGGRALPAAYTEIYDDAYAYLGSWAGGNDYEVVATAYYGGVAAEAEILLRVSDTDSTVRAYEFLYNTGGGWQFVRWNGPLGDFTVLNGGATPGSGNDTQTRARIIGSTVELFWRATVSDPWTNLTTIDDGALATGRPGMAFYAHAADQNLDKIGFSEWCVTRL